MGYKSWLEEQRRLAATTCETCIHFANDKCRYGKEKVDGTTCDQYYPKNK